MRTESAPRSSQISSKSDSAELKPIPRKLREQKVKQLYEQGYTYRQIAKQLRISINEISRILKQSTEPDPIQELRAELDGLRSRLDELSSQLKELDSADSDIWDRLDEISYALRHALGSVGIQIRCPRCAGWSQLEFHPELKKWICGKCNQIPF